MKRLSSVFMKLEHYLRMYAYGLLCFSTLRIYINLWTILITVLQTPVVLSEVRLSPASNAYVTDLSWNPAVSNMLTCCISDRTLSVYTFNSNGSFEVKSLPKESNSL